MRKILALLLCVSMLPSCDFNSTLVVNKNTGKTQDTTKDGATIKNVPVSQVQVIPDSIVINEGSKNKLNASVIYSDNSRNSDIIWSSSDNTIAAVNETTGEVSGVKAGIVTIVATSQRDTGKKAAVTVTVKKAEVTEAITKVTPSEASIRVGDTVRLSAQIQMSDGSISPNVTWNSDNKSIALVSNGLVTGIAEGTTTITATADGDSTKKAMAKITVSNSAAPMPVASPTVQPTTVPAVISTPAATTSPTPSASTAK